MTSENAENHVSPQQPAPDADRKSDEQPGNPQTQVSLAATQSQATPPNRHCEVTCNTKRDLIDKATLGLELFGLAVLIIYTIATIAIWCANKKAADAAKSAADTAHDTLVMSERSWVGQSGPVWLEFFNGADKQTAVNIHLTLENFGHSPAVSVFHSAELVEHDDLARAAEMTCQFARAQAGIKVPGMATSESSIRHTGQTIFPQHKWGSIYEDGPIKSRAAVLYAVGCVIYRDDVTDGVWWTRFCQETPWLASSYKSGQPLVTCNCEFRKF